MLGRKLKHASVLFQDVLPAARSATQERGGETQSWVPFLQAEGSALQDRKQLAEWPFSYSAMCSINDNSVLLVASIGKESGALQDATKVLSYI